MEVATHAAGAYRVDIAGSLADVRFPPLCARCAAPPAGTLTVTKMFRHTDSDGPTTYAFGAVAVPFCATCLDAHARERRPPDPRVLRSLRNAFLLRCLPYVIPIAVNLFMIQAFARPAVRALLEGDTVGALAFGAATAFFAILLAMFWRLVLKAREQLIASAAGDPDAQYVEIVRGHLGTACVIPGPPTSAVAAVDFDDEDYQFFEANRRTFAFANPVVGAGFAAANAGLVWHPELPSARRAAWMRHVALVVLGVGAAVALVLHYFGGSLLGV